MLMIDSSKRFESICNQENTSFLGYQAFNSGKKVADMTIVF